MTRPTLPDNPEPNMVQFIVTGPIMWNNEQHRQVFFLRPGEREARIWCEMLPGGKVGTSELIMPPAINDFKPPFYIACWILPPDLKIVRDFRGFNVFPDWSRFGLPPFHFSVESDTNDAAAIAEKVSAAYEKHLSDKAAQAQTNAWYEKALKIIEDEYSDAVEALNRTYKRKLRKLKREHAKRIATYKLEIKEIKP